MQGSKIKTPVLPSQKDLSVSKLEYFLHQQLALGLPQQDHFPTFHLWALRSCWGFQFNPFPLVPTLVFNKMATLWENPRRAVSFYHKALLALPTNRFTKSWPLLDRVLNLGPLWPSKSPNLSVQGNFVTKLSLSLGDQIFSSTNLAPKQFNQFLRWLCIARPS